MRVPQFCLVLVAVCFTACSDSGKEPSEPVFEKTDIFIISPMQTKGYPSGTLVDGTYYFYLTCGFNKDNNCLLSDDLYAWIDVVDDKMNFMEDYFLDDSGFACFRYETVLVSDGETYGLNQDKGCDLVFVVLEEGTYEFALKFNNPKTGKYYVTPRYRVKVWVEKKIIVHTEVTLVE